MTTIADIIVLDYKGDLESKEEYRQRMIDAHREPAKELVLFNVSMGHIAIPLDELLGGYTLDEFVEGLLVLSFEGLIP
jgi:hypothetical protein